MMNRSLSALHLRGMHSFSPIVAYSDGSFFGKFSLCSSSMQMFLSCPMLFHDQISITISGSSFAKSISNVVTVQSLNYSTIYTQTQSFQSSSSLLINHCLFLKCTASDLGGCFNVSNTACSVVVQFSYFIECSSSASVSFAYRAASGGAFAVYSLSTIVLSCCFIDDYGPSTGNAFYSATTTSGTNTVNSTVISSPKISENMTIPVLLDKGNQGASSCNFTNNLAMTYGILFFGQAPTTNYISFCHFCDGNPGRAFETSLSADTAYGSYVNFVNLTNCSTSVILVWYKTHYYSNFVFINSGSIICSYMSGYTPSAVFTNCYFDNGFSGSGSVQSCQSGSQSFSLNSISGTIGCSMSTQPFTRCTLENSKNVIQIVSLSVLALLID